ncbi:expressed unknown protein [Seminavis robusta]|uniref:Uncharacterized protein n=1 Tax=Seminavis robusta TaxID=568900 RepID=A0A9N8HCA0_9STRA|nr:expressed unknown protein [Seminavis robusta]|eukprot:Sro398_g134780.1 n/a (153) ;mRNA; f:68545-69003
MTSTPPGTRSSYGQPFEDSRGMTAGYEDAWRNRDVLQKLRARKEQIVTGAGMRLSNPQTLAKRSSISPGACTPAVHRHITYRRHHTVFIQQQDEVISNQITAVKLARKCLYHDLSDPDKKAEQRVRRTQMKKQLDVSCGKQWLSRLWQQRGG